MSNSLKQEIAKIQDEDLKKKLNAKKGLTPVKALQSIQAWRNGWVVLRVITSIFTLGILPLFYFLWARKKKVYSDWVTIPLHKTQDAITGLKNLATSQDISDKTDSKENSNVKEDSEHDPSNDSDSSKESASEVRENKDQSKKKDSSVKDTLKKTSHEELESGKDGVFDANESKNQSKKSNKKEKVIYFNQKLEHFKPKTVALNFPNAAAHQPHLPQVQHNGLLSYKCGGESNLYFTAYDIQGNTIVSNTSHPVEHRGEIVSFYPDNNRVTYLALQSNFIQHISQRVISWTTVRLAVIPRFFIPLFVKTDSRGELIEAVCIFHHKKNHIALSRYKNGKSETQEIKLSDGEIEDAISCATVNKDRIFVGRTDGKISIIKLGDNYSLGDVQTSTFSDQSILSIAIDHSGKDLAILLSNGNVHHYGKEGHHVIDIDIHMPNLTAIGFRNEDLLIATPDNVLVAKSIGSQQEYLSEVSQNAKAIKVSYPVENIKKEFLIGRKIIAVIFSDDIHDVKPYKICELNNNESSQYVLFEKGREFQYDFLEVFNTPSAHLAFYYLDFLTKEMQFYNQKGELIGAVQNINFKWNAEIVIESFKAQRGIGSKIHVDGSFTVTEDGKTTRYDFTESKCTTETVANPSAAYTKVLSRPKRKEKQLTQLGESTPAVETVVDTSTNKASEQKVADIGDGVRDYDFVWTATTDSAEHLGCKRIKYPDGTIEYEIGLWPEKFDHVGRLPVHTMFLTKDENAINWMPILSNEKQWNFFSYTNKSLVIYDDAGKQILKKDIDNTNKTLIPVEVSTTNDGSINLTLIDIYKSNHLLLLNLNRKALFEVKAPNITTAFYDAENQHLYFVTKLQRLYRVNIATQEQKVIDLTDLRPELVKTAITKIVLNEDRSLICLRFGAHELRTYLVNFNNSEAKKVGYVEIENADIFDMQFTNNDVVIRSVTTIGYHEAVNILPKNMSNRF